MPIAGASIKWVLSRIKSGSSSSGLTRSIENGWHLAKLIFSPRAAAAAFLFRSFSDWARNQLTRRTFFSLSLSPPSNVFSPIRDHTMIRRREKISPGVVVQTSFLSFFASWQQLAAAHKRGYGPYGGCPSRVGDMREGEVSYESATFVRPPAGRRICNLSGGERRRRTGRRKLRGWSKRMM